jgi:peroxiredoxin Q/BCP
MNKDYLNIELLNQDGNKVTLKDYSGRWIVLYFYPKDNTPGCTTEACSFRDLADEFKGLDAVVIGVSKDSATSHQKFIAKYNLNFNLLVDEQLLLAKEFNSFGLKKFMGREYQGIFRNTFILNPKGDVVKEYLNVKPVGHASQVANDLKALKVEQIA